MKSKKELFQNPDLRCGGFYELCIQACPSKSTEPIELYTNYIWTLANVEGPYNAAFEKINVDTENNQYDGIITLQDYTIPFKTFNIREQSPLETGFNWFDISFYTAALDHIFGLEDQRWSDNESCPKILKDFLIDTMKKLYSIYPFQLAFVDFEISGQYYLDDLRKELNNCTDTRFFVGRKHIYEIKEEFRVWVSLID